MRKLKVNLDNFGDTGMCNILMGIDIALGIAFLTKRDSIDFFYKKNIFNSGYELGIFDLFSLNFPYTLTLGGMTSEGVVIAYGKDTFNNTSFCFKDQPNSQFLNGREECFDLSLVVDEQVISIYPGRTLASYSYLFYLQNGINSSMIKFIKESITPLSLYKNIAQDIVEVLRNERGGYRSIHLRKGDFLFKEKVAKYSVDKLKDVRFLNGLNTNNCLTVIHTDTNEDSDLTSIESNGFVVFEKKFKDLLSGLNVVEVGLISMLVASMSSDFVGTMSSTFTSTIQKYRKYNGFEEYFRYLFSEKESISINEFGCINEGSFGTYTWNRRDFSKNMNEYFWYFENRECYENPKSKSNSIRVFPNFLSKLEVYQLIKMSVDAQNSEHISHEGRDKQVFPIRSTDILNNIQKRCSELLGYPNENLENELQMFTGLVGSKIGYHEDSIHESPVSGKRIATILLYLNDDYEGSILTFPNASMSIKPSSGMMISYPLLGRFFEHDKTFGHLASEVLSGTKRMCLFSLRERSIL